MKKHRLMKLPPFNPEKYVKRTIAVSYWKDSNDLLTRVRIYSHYVENDSLSIKAKNFVDLIMAIECSLKSLIISLAPKDESPEGSYLAARTCSHNLDRLYNELKVRAKNRVKILRPKDELVLHKANTLGVNSRYQVTSFMFLSQEDWADRSMGTGKVSSILCHDFIDELYRVSHVLHKISGDTQDKYLGHYARINTRRMDEIEKRHTKFIATLGKKF